MLILPVQLPIKGVRINIGICMSFNLKICSIKQNNKIASLLKGGGNMLGLR